MMASGTGMETRQYLHTGVHWSWLLHVLCLRHIACGSDNDHYIESALHAVLAYAYAIFHGMNMR